MGYERLSKENAYLKMYPNNALILGQITACVVDNEKPVQLCTVACPSLNRR